MLGTELLDPDHTESAIERVSGLGLLDVQTVFARDKVTSQVRALAAGTGAFLGGYDGMVDGYEIHMGRTMLGPGLKNAFLINTRSGQEVNLPDGAENSAGTVWGTYIHGVFDTDGFRRHLINQLKRRKGLDVVEQEPGTKAVDRRQQGYDQLAALVRNSLDMHKIYQLLGI